MEKVDKRRILSDKRLDNLKKAREAAAAKKKLLKEQEQKRAEDEAKISVLENLEPKSDIGKAYESKHSLQPEEDIESTEDIEEPVIVPKPVKRKPKRTEKISLSDDLKEEIKEIIYSSLQNPPETKEQKRQRKLQETYEYIKRKAEEEKVKQLPQTASPHVRSHKKILVCLVRYKDESV